MTTPFPDFTSPTLFPIFPTCPLTEDPPPPHPDPYYLLGTITENMTLTPVTPTFICKDRDGHAFAVTLKLTSRQSGEGSAPASGDGNFYESPRGRKAFGKGKCVVVPMARRKGAREENAELGQKEKKGFIEGLWRDGSGSGGEGIFVLPTGLMNLIEIGERRRKEEGKKSCQGCGKSEEEVEGMVRCKGCESVWYCGKDCQVLGWSEKGHKSECKVLKAVKDIFL
ncbi:hypothetical protein HYFRA_00003470 [Hymenoscyphus fraxineus]|uniref:MYND-type domain-containing protein n=1 Tax=Hymenoscyphus fraxineus TaxID=746836 RepID=A0A9N9KWH7_9HELO|nr:hypothetical protein HYFRA_00003470 [Hymenoscyphus fraxineus]